MRTLIASDHDEIGHAARRVLLAEGQDSPVVSLDSAGVAFKEYQPEVVIFVLPPAPELALRRLGELRALSRARILAAGPSSDSKLVLRALRGGADDFLEATELSEELRACMVRLRGQLVAPEEAGQVIALLSPSGGGGASTVACSLGPLLAKANKRALMVDLKTFGGDVAALLNLKPIYTVSDLCQNVTRMDKVMFERALLRHSSGVHVLGAPRSPNQSRHLTADGVRQVLVLARVLFQITLVDVDRTFGDEQSFLLRQADKILIVFRLEFTSLRHVRQTIDLLQDQGVSRERLVLVANRYGQPKELAGSEVEQALGMKIGHYLVDDARTVIAANNNGVPVALEAPNAKVSKALAQIAAVLPTGKS
jgi:pilus assembly protein CpaE